MSPANQETENLDSGAYPSNADDKAAGKTRLI